METKEYLIEEAFNITGRGVAVILDGITNLDVGKEYRARLYLQDASTIEATAFKEWILRRNIEPLEKEAFMLSGIKKEDIPSGTKIKLSW